MQIWAPPTPPQNDNDLYIDHSIGFWYEHNIMSETNLPPIYVKKEAKRLKVDPSAFRMYSITSTFPRKILLTTLNYRKCGNQEAKSKEGRSSTRTKIYV